FVFSKISNHGTNHPVIARLHLQTFDLLQATTLSPQTQEQVGHIYFEAGRRLLRCFEITNELSEKQIELEAETQPARIVPYLIDLDRLVETFLYEAKNFLRD